MTETCPVPGMSALHEEMVEAPSLTTQVAYGASTFAWYAMPDFIRCKGARFALKSLLSAGMIWYYAHSKNKDFELVKDFVIDRGQVRENALDLLPPTWSQKTKVGACFGFVAALAGVSLLIEKLVFKRGERRRESGKTLPHTRQAIGLTAICVGALLLDNKIPQD